MQHMKDSDLQIIGQNALVDVKGHQKHVPAKVDTGADSSAIWASQVAMSKGGILSFVLFDGSSPFYTGEVIERHAYQVAFIRSSNGAEQIRYKIELPLRIDGKLIRAQVTLSDRSKNHFPILLGRRTLNKKFVVDVSVQQYQKPKTISRGLRKEFKKDPHGFHLKYHQKAK
jgi:hypothetical protein